MEREMSIRALFDNGAVDYDGSRRMLIPCFAEFYGTAVEIMPFETNDKIKVLDLGAGTGLFTSYVAEKYPYAEYTLCDISPKMLEIARQRFSSSKLKIDFVEADFINTNISGEYDFVISALSIHHISGVEKKELFHSLFSCLSDDGMFINADQVLGSTDSIEKAYRTDWLKKVKEGGVSKESLSAALKRMEEDKMSTLDDQLNWLRQTGFSDVNCWYKNYSFVVFSGRKSICDKSF